MVRIPGQGWQQFEARTRDISARGAYVFLNVPMQEEAKIELVLTLPPEVTLTESIRVRCTGRVVRVDRDSAGNQVGVAAQVTCYEFLVDD